MNQKQSYRSDEPQPEYFYEVTVNGRQLRKGMHATLAPKTPGGNSRRYEFCYAEDYTGTLLLTFFGPLRSPRRSYRMVREAAIETVHVKSEARE